jgi:quercetin dioxygenase-like cupin family protein
MASQSTAQPGAARTDPVRVDPKHYKVEFENEKVRVLRIKYGSHEKSVMHGHPDSVMVSLTGFRGKFTFPDGRTEEISTKAGETIFVAGEQHLPENLGDTPLELILVELKG